MGSVAACTMVVIVVYVHLYSSDYDDKLTEQVLGLKGCLVDLSIFWVCS